MRRIRRSCIEPRSEVAIFAYCCCF
ncbi:hypothetical protein RHECNPAF_280055 [Rhizobium etli CNPAF512]|nr:hypothetical protein RHECNPAF_280055 [Rhizobium etli CNPAF512]